MFRNRWFLPTVLLIASCFIIGECVHVRAQDSDIPEKLKDQWETAAPGAEKLDAKLIRNMLAAVANEGAKAEGSGPVDTDRYKNISSIVIVRNGKLVVEEYFPRTEGDRRAKAFRRVALQEQTSATKSVTSILIGIAIERKLIKSVDEKVSTLLPEYADLFADEDKGKIRLRDLLSMQAGLSWDEWTLPYTDERNDHIRMLRSDDPLRYVLERSPVAPAGTKFAYSSGFRSSWVRSSPMFQESPPTSSPTSICLNRWASPISIGPSTPASSCRQVAAYFCGRATWPKSAASISMAAAGRESRSLASNGSRNRQRRMWMPPRFRRRRGPTAMDINGGSTRSKWASRSSSRIAPAAEADNSF